MKDTERFDLNVKSETKENNRNQEREENERKFYIKTKRSKDRL